MNRSSGYNPGLQSHMSPCNFGRTQVFWDPCQVDNAGCHACARIPDVPIPCFDLPNFQSGLSVAELTLVCWVSTSHMRHRCAQPSCKQLCWQYRTFDVIKSIALECVLAQQAVHRSKILGDVMDSRNSKTIEQRRSDCGRRLGDGLECNTGLDLWPKLGFIKQLTS